MFNASHLWLLFEILWNKTILLWDRSTLRSCVIRGNWKTQAHTGRLLWITQRFRTIAAFPINSERLDGSVFIHFHGIQRLNAGIEHALLEQLTFFSNASIVVADVDTQVELSSPRKIADKRRQSHVNAGTVPETKNAGT